jgi:hypothetical protein
VQSRARDNDRMNDMQVMKKALGMFYAENGYYPARPEFFNATFRRDTLKIPDGSVSPPNATSAISYCWADTPYRYCYVGTPASGGSFDCGTSGEQCAGYRISYRLESDPSTMITMSN